jgi:hypothetical protein
LASGGRRECCDRQSKLQMDQRPTKQVPERAELPQDLRAASVAPQLLLSHSRSAVAPDLELPRIEACTPLVTCNSIRESLAKGAFEPIRRFTGRQNKVIKSSGVSLEQHRGCSPAIGLIAYLPAPTHKVFQIATPNGFFCSWPIATDDALTANRRFRGHWGHEAIFGAQRSVANDPYRPLLPIRLRMFLALRNPACPPVAPRLLFPSTTGCFQHKPFPASRPDRAHTSWLLSTAS